LHWADQPSLLLLQFVARELGGGRLLIIGTYRDVELSRQHPLAETLGELTRERLFQRVLLRGLGQEDVARFVEIATGVTPPSGLTQAVYTQTEGNPLFVTEVVRLLVQDGELTQERKDDWDSWSVRIPEGVREVIGRRLNRLSQRCNETLTLASVVGREFSLEQLKPLIEDLSEDRLLEVLEEALAARVIEELPQVVGRYQFTHALIQETLIGELSLTRRVRLHARIAEALESLYGGNLEAHAAELSHHFARAEMATGTEKLVRYATLAGHRALDSYAYEEALGHFEVALNAKGISADGTQPINDPETADLLLGMGKAQTAVLPFYRIQEAVHSLGRALEYYISVEDVSNSVAILEIPLGGGGPITFPTTLIKQTLDLVPTGSLEEGRLLARYGQDLGNTNQYDASREALERAIEIARKGNDLSLEMAAQAYACEVDFFNFQHQQSLEKGLRAIELAQHLGDLYFESLSGHFASAAAANLGDLATAKRLARSTLESAEKLRHNLLNINGLMVSGYMAMLEGDWSVAREFNNRAQVLAYSGQARIHFQRAVLEHEVGNFEEGQRYLNELPGVIDLGWPAAPAYLAFAAPLVSYISGAPFDMHVCWESSKAILSSHRLPQHFQLMAQYALGLCAVLRGENSEDAATQYSALSPYGGQVAGAWVGENCDRLLALLSRTMSNISQAIVHFEDSLVLCRRSGYRPQLAWTCCDYADTLLQRNNPGDRERAMSLLDESLAISTELGMRPLMERVLSRRDILKA
ncbi:MAG: hypothetical protein ACE5Q6_12685, partial [Dehalococcoidia bacterium]